MDSNREYQSLYEAGLSRAIGDWTLGMNATRLYTLKYAQGRQVLSIGRVQTPTLALIVNRQQEIENFKPEPYWVLTTNYRDTVFTAVLEQDEEETATVSQDKGANGNGSGKANDVARRGFTSEEEGRKALEQIKDAPFTITSVTKKNGTEPPTISVRPIRWNLPRRAPWKGNWIRFSEIEKTEYSIKPKAAVCMGADGRLFVLCLLQK